MTECEECGKYVHPDYIRECPYCGMTLCEDCFGHHVANCEYGNF